MEKSDAVASLGQSSLLQPTRVRAALRANDRLKLYLTVLQAAAAHAHAPQQASLDLRREIAAADFYQGFLESALNADEMLTEIEQAMRLQLIPKDAADEKGVPLTKDESREAVYGMPYETWKATYQSEATPDQVAAMKKTHPGH